MCLALSGVMVVAQNNPDPTYAFRYSTGGDGPAQIWREERKQPDGTIIGKYGYIDPNGEERVVEYTASPTQFLASGDIGPDAAAMRYAAELQEEHMRERQVAMREWQKAAQQSPPVNPWNSAPQRFQSQRQQKTNSWSNQQAQQAPQKTNSWSNQQQQQQDLPEPPAWAQQEVAAPPPPVPAAPLAPARKMPGKGSSWQGTSQLTAWNSDWNKNSNQWNTNWNAQPVQQPASNDWNSGNNNNWNQERPARTSWNDSPQDPWKDSWTRNTPPAPAFQRQQIQRRSGSNSNVPSSPQLNSLTPRNNWPKPTTTQSQPISAGPFSYSFEINHSDGSSTSFSQ